MKGLTSRNVNWVRGPARGNSAAECKCRKLRERIKSWKCYHKIPKLGGQSREETGEVEWRQNRASLEFPSWLSGKESD